MPGPGIDDKIREEISRGNTLFTGGAVG